MSLIWNVEELRRFYEVLVEMDYYGMIFVKSRNKYVMSEGDEHRGKRVVLEQFVLDTKKMSFSDLVNRIERVSAILEAGLYLNKKGTVIESDSVVFYLNFNSLDPEEAWRKLQIKFLESGFQKGVVEVYQSELHKSSRFKVHRLDVDTKDEVEIGKLKELLVKGSVMMSVETKNGYHVILKNKSVSGELYRFVESHPDMSMIKNGMMALPGCYQAGFEVKILDWEGF